MSPNQPLSNSNDGEFQYPGYGQRRDIFYEPTPEEKAAARSSTLTIGEMQVLQGPPKSRKRLFLLVGGVLSAVVIAVVVIAAMAGNQPKKISDQSAASGSSDQGNTGSDEVTTSCYSFFLPPPHDPITDQAGCAGSYLTGTSREAGVVVEPTVAPYQNLEEMVADWKVINPSQTIISEADIRFGNYSAKGIVWQKADGSGGVNLSILTFVGINPNGPSIYTEKDSPISGFEIKGRYDEYENSRTIFDEILASWQWK